MMNAVKNENGSVKTILLIVLALVLAAGAFYVGMTLTADKQPEISSTFVSDKLEAASELTSARMVYNGLVHYQDGDIPFLTQKAFSMTYRAVARAGIDLSKVTSTVTDTEVRIRVPAIEVLDITVDTDSIEYYDQKAALFNAETKTDALDAIEAAKDDVRENGNLDELKATAKTQVEVLLTGLFKDCIGDRELKIIFE